MKNFHFAAALLIVLAGCALNRPAASPVPQVDVSGPGIRVCPAPQQPERPGGPAAIVNIYEDGTIETGDGTRIRKHPFEDGTIIEPPPLESPPYRHTLPPSPVEPGRQTAPPPAPRPRAEQRPAGDGFPLSLLTLPSFSFPRPSGPMVAGILALIAAVPIGLRYRHKLRNVLRTIRATLAYWLEPIDDADPPARTPARRTARKQ